MSRYYNFVLYQWQIRAWDQTNVQNAVTRGFITQNEASAILATPQVAQ